MKRGEIFVISISKTLIILLKAPGVRVKCQKCRQLHKANIIRDRESVWFHLKPTTNSNDLSDHNPARGLAD